MSLAFHAVVKHARDFNDAGLREDVIDHVRRTGDRRLAAMTDAKAAYAQMEFGPVDRDNTGAIADVAVGIGFIPSMLCKLAVLTKFANPLSRVQAVCSSRSCASSQAVSCSSRSRLSFARKVAKSDALRGSAI